MHWYRDLDGRQRKAFWACSGGWALDAMDVQMYALVLPTIMALWSLTKAEAGMLGTVALLASSLGGAIAGNLADRIGRVRVLQASILWFSAFTCLSGLAQNFEHDAQGNGFVGRIDAAGDGDRPFVGSSRCWRAGNNASRTHRNARERHAGIGREGPTVRVRPAFRRQIRQIR